MIRILRRFAAALRLLACAVMLVGGCAMLREESPSWQWKGLLCVAALVVAPLTLKGKL